MVKNKQKIIPLVLDTYLSVIKNSIGTNLFRNFYAKMDNKKTDIMKNGELSCAFYVSSILALFRLIKEVHGTVDSTIKDLRTSGWKIIKKPEAGCILVWEKFDFGNNDIHQHIGFYIGNNRAISNNYKLGCPTKHRWTFGGKRKVDIMFWNPKLK